MIFKHRRSQGPNEPCPPKFLENIVILCFERRFSIQNSVIRLKSNILAPPKFFGWLRHCFQAKWIACGCIYKVRNREWKGYCDFVDIEYQKHIAHSVTRWLSLYPSLPRMLKLYPASHSYFISTHKPTVVLKRFFFYSLNELCLRHWAIFNHLMSSFLFWRR